ncbi:carotenoid oxygenase family protein [Streptomyces sp. NPDC051020]|uniref:carotenoid oxygenase family protein n=1 Tax=Streptomyces sp. NPDC051020 TaxID=3155409 RepID=UPI003430494A
MGVPAESPVAEDDGYVMAYVHDPERSAADLVILSAQDFTGELVARIHLPVRAARQLGPYGLPRGFRVRSGVPPGRLHIDEALMTDGVGDVDFLDLETLTEAADDVLS